MNYIIKHLSDNTGDENVSKLVWIVIAFVFGSILLTIVNSYDIVDEWLIKNLNKLLNFPNNYF